MSLSPVVLLQEQIDDVTTELEVVAAQLRFFRTRQKDLKERLSVLQLTKQLLEQQTVTEVTEGEDDADLD